MLDSNLILIGPIATGKTTVAELLGAALGIPVIELDELRWNYYPEIGYSQDKAREIHQAGGMPAVIAYWKPFEIYSVERLLQDHPAGHILSFGAGQSVYEDPAFFERAQKAVAPHAVVLLLPSPNATDSIRILSERFRAHVNDMNEEGYAMIDDLNRHFIEHPSNSRLATLTVYTEGKTPAETCGEIIESLHLRNEE
jgi:shikimate kinase